MSKGIFTNEIFIGFLLNRLLAVLFNVSNSTFLHVKFIKKKEFFDLEISMHSVHIYIKF